MSAQDGDVAWWSLPGPRAFANEALAAAARDVAALRVPEPRPRGMVDAILGRFTQDFDARAVAIDAGAAGSGGSIAHVLAEACGLDGAQIGAVADLVRAPRMAHTAFLVDRIAAADLGRWAAFLRALVDERRKGGARGGPYVAVFLPVDGSEADSARLCGPTRPVMWRGRISRLDSVARLGTFDIGRGGLSERLAAATAIEVAAWSREMLETLMQMRLEDRLWPFAALKTMAAERSWPRPSWENGLVDLWDGFPAVHAAAAMAHPDLADDIARRVWAGQVAVLMPLLDEIRRGVIRSRLRVLSRLASPANPYRKMINDRTFLIETPWELEWYELQIGLEGSLSPLEQKFLETCRQVRRRTAHAWPVGVEDLREFARQWEAVADFYTPGVAGWDRSQTGWTA